MYGTVTEETLTKMSAHPGYGVQVGEPISITGVSHRNLSEGLLTGTQTKNSPNTDNSSLYL